LGVRFLATGLAADLFAALGIGLAADLFAALGVGLAARFLLSTYALTSSIDRGLRYSSCRLSEADMALPSFSLKIFCTLSNLRWSK
jgi:hypothetical protein